MDEDELVSIILGRPFFVTARAVIDVHNVKLSLRVGNETVTFNVGKSMKSKYFRNDNLHCADHTAKVVREQWVDTIDHHRKWVEAKEEGGLNEFLRPLLKHLEKMLKRCEKTNLVLNWEKCHFMINEGIVLGHKVSGSRIEVDKAKIKSISKLPYPTNVKAIQSFMGHAGFYRRAVLRQRKDKHFQPIHYASKTMNEAQDNYTTTEKELLAVVFAFNKF
uniref:DNA-directed DNA polymerase n=1 Tax=Tanacetum cinerariifolium TaxID=118510 RepID=A0A6L2LAA3_TANCI|nr:DNA-directed DNA polymerase [Tanacetum cinerariifolium]